MSIFPTGENAQFWTCGANTAEKLILITVIFVEDSSFYFFKVVQGWEIFCNINQIVNGTLAKSQNYCLKSKNILGGAHLAAVTWCLVPFGNL